MNFELLALIEGISPCDLEIKSFLKQKGICNGQISSGCPQEVVLAENTTDDCRRCPKYKAASRLITEQRDEWARRIFLEGLDGN